MADEPQAEPQQKQEKQIPVKPKKSGGGGEIKLPVLIGAIAGTLILMAGIFYAVFWFGVKPYLAQDAEATGEEGKEKTEKVEKPVENEDPEYNFAKLSDEEDFVLGDKGIHSVQSGRITTNPKASNQIVLMNINMEFRAREDDERFPIAEGEAAAVEELEKSPHLQRALIEVKGAINSMIGSYTVQELYNINRDSLASQIKNTLEPTFKGENLYLRKITLIEYLIQ